MLGLPSTTEVNGRIPKEAFYRNLSLNPKTRTEFVHLIESVAVANSIKPSTTGIRDGMRVHEILILEVHLKGTELPTRALEAIAAANPHKIVYYIDPGEAVCVLRDGLQQTSALHSFALQGSNLDEIWDSLCAQVIFGDVDGAGLNERIARENLRTRLEKEVAKLDAACRRTRQIHRKNELYNQLRQKQRELESLNFERQ